MLSPTTDHGDNASASQPSHLVSPVHDSADAFYILPPPPNPSADAGLKVTPGTDDSGTHTPPSPGSLDVFALTPVTALKREPSHSSSYTVPNC